MAPKKVFAMVLAGGEGKRLMPLTADRAKPAVPFGGQFRLIDFILSNIVSSGYLQAVVLTQYKSHSLDKHISKTWRMSALLQNYVTPVPAQQRKGPHWFLGSADAIYQSLNLIDEEKPDYVLVVGADNIFRMDFSQMVDAHIASGRSMSVAAIRQPIELSDQFGVIETDAADPTKIQAFVEKPEETPGLADDPTKVLASMGNYVFNTDALIEAVTRDADDPDSKHDMGGSIVPKFVEQGDATVYDFIDNVVPGSTQRDRDYWRDVGTIDAFYDANMDLISINPVFNLYNTQWPIYTARTNYPPAKFVHAGPGRIGQAVDSYVAAGAVVSGATVQGSILSPGSYFHSWSSVTESVIMDRVDVGRHSQIHRAIVDKEVVIPPRTQIGLDREHDLARGFHVTDSGITVIGKGTVIEP